MYTQCPHCKTLFNVTAEQLRSARGTVQCGECIETFDALQYLTDGHIPKIEHHGDRTVLRNPSSDWTLADESKDPLVHEEMSYADTIVELTDLNHSLESVFSDTQADSGDPLLARNIALDALMQDEPQSGERVARVQRPTERSPASTNVFDALIPAIVPETTTRALGQTGELSALRDLESKWVAPDAQAPMSQAGINIKVERNEKEPDEYDDTIEEEDDEDPREDEVESTESPYPRVLHEDITRLAERKNYRRLRMVFMFLSIGLLVTLGIQYAWFQPADMAERYPMTRPWLSRWCEYTHCLLPEQRDPRQVQVVSRDVRVHPKYEGALLITAVLVNNAPFVQPYPDMRFTLFNVNGQTIASRDFVPRDYLPEDVVLTEGMAPDSPTQITLDIVAPEEASVSFEFKFL